MRKKYKVTATVEYELLTEEVTEMTIDQLAWRVRQALESHDPLGFPVDEVRVTVEDPQFVDRGGWATVPEIIPDQPLPSAQDVTLPSMDPWDEKTPEIPPELIQRDRDIAEFQGLQDVSVTEEEILAAKAEIDAYHRRKNQEEMDLLMAEDILELRVQARKPREHTPTQEDPWDDLADTPVVTKVEGQASFQEQYETRKKLQKELAKAEEEEMRTIYELNETMDAVPTEEELRAALKKHLREVRAKEAAKTQEQKDVEREGLRRALLQSLSRSEQMMEEEPIPLSKLKLRKTSVSGQDSGSTTGSNSGAGDFYANPPQAGIQEHIPPAGPAKQETDELSRLWRERTEDMKAALSPPVEEGREHCKRPPWEKGLGPQHFPEGYGWKTVEGDFIEDTRVALEERTLEEALEQN